MSSELCKFSGEDIDSDKGSIDRWIEQFEVRAKMMGWNDEQMLFQLKAHLEKTAERAEKEKMSYEVWLQLSRIAFTWWYTLRGHGLHLDSHHQPLGFQQTSYKYPL